MNLNSEAQRAHVSLKTTRETKTTDSGAGEHPTEHLEATEVPFNPVQPSDRQTKRVRKTRVNKRTAAAREHARTHHDAFEPRPEPPAPNPRSKTRERAKLALSRASVKHKAAVHRPKTAHGGVRIGEASNPGPGHGKANNVQKSVARVRKGLRANKNKGPRPQGGKSAPSKPTTGAAPTKVPTAPSILPVYWHEQDDMFLLIPMEHPPVHPAQIAESGLPRAHWHERKKTVMSGAALRHHLKQDESKRKNGAGKRRVCLCRVPGYIDHHDCPECNSAYLPLLHEETAAAITLQLEQHKIAVALTRGNSVDYEGAEPPEVEYLESPQEHKLATIPEEDKHELDHEIVPEGTNHVRAGPTVAMHSVPLVIHTTPTLETGTVVFDEIGVNNTITGMIPPPPLTPPPTPMVNTIAKVIPPPPSTQPPVLKLGSLHIGRACGELPFGQIEIVERLTRHSGDYGYITNLVNKMRDKVTTADVQVNTDNNPYQNITITKKARRLFRFFRGGFRLKIRPGRRIDNTPEFTGKTLVPIFKQLYLDMQKIRQVDAPRGNDRGAMARNLNSAIQFYIYQHKDIAKYQQIQFFYDGVTLSGSDIIHNTQIQLLSKYYIRDNNDVKTVGEATGVPRE
jgi:hypothetical protein